MSNRCYIVGAGLSKPFGFPLAGEISSLVFEHIRNKTNGHDLIARRLHQWCNCLSKLYPCFNFNTSWPDFEDLITVLGEWEEYRRLVEETPTPQDPMTPKHIKRVLIGHLALLLCEKTPAKEATEFDLVRRFVKKCSENRWPVISFNWDIVLEAAAQDENTTYSYDKKNEGDLKLAKPHGSINVAELKTHFFEKEWGGNNKCQELLEYDDSVVIRATDARLVKKSILDPLGVYGNNSSSASASCGALIVEPTAKKAYSSPWIQSQWKRAFEFVRAAEELVVIGFSLPPTDIRPRVLLQLAGIGRQTKPRVILVDPKACDVVRRYQQFVPLSIECKTCNWIDWFDQEGSVA